jgi:hypothetical protein
LNVEEAVTWAADSTNYVSFKFMVGEDVQIGKDGDLVDIFRLYSGVDEGALALSRIEPAGLVLGLRDASGSVLDYLKNEAGDWLCIEPQIDNARGGRGQGPGPDRPGARPRPCACAHRAGLADRAAHPSARPAAVAQA